MLVKPGEKTVTVVDSIMGSGKTSWAIQYINKSPKYMKFMFITPYLTEVERIINNTSREFVQPESSGDRTKLESLKEAVSNGVNIAATHKLFQNCDAELIRLLDAENYVLILDEVMNVINEVEITKADIQILRTAKTDKGDPIITINDFGYVRWQDENYDLGNFSSIRNIANSGNLIMYNESAMYWLFPVEVFNSFGEVFILTYMFKGQIQCYYYDLFKVSYEFKTVGYNEDMGYHLIPYNKFQENREELKQLINLYYATARDKRDMNKIGYEKFAFSNTHLKKSIKEKHYTKMIKDNVYNFYRHKVGCTTDQIIWTTYKDFRGKLETKRISDRFVAINARATNEYADATTCIYIGNRFMIPTIKQIFQRHGVKVDEDLFALSELLQWLFRSNIRKGGEIDVYIPSRRMRTLLEMYLNNEI